VRAAARRHGRDGRRQRTEIALQRDKGLLAVDAVALEGVDVDNDEAGAAAEDGQACPRPSGEPPGDLGDVEGGAVRPSS
jgi:hypothetical protein